MHPQNNLLAVDISLLKLTLGQNKVLIFIFCSLILLPKLQSSDGLGMDSSSLYFHLSGYFWPQSLNEWLVEES